jgi:hypothetical protein
MDIVGNLKLINGAKMLVRELTSGGYSLELIDDPHAQIATGDDPNKRGMSTNGRCMCLTECDPFVLRRTILALADVADEQSK